MTNNKLNNNLSKSIGTWEVMVAGVALVVAASTLVSDFAGYFTLGGAFAVALLLGFAINLFLGMSAAELSVAYPRADKAFKGRWFIPMTLTGVAMTLVSLYYAFAGGHAEYGGRALVVLLGALTATTISFVFPQRETETVLEKTTAVPAESILNEIMEREEAFVSEGV